MYMIVFETDIFNLSKPKASYINECCYGDDTAAWLKGELAKHGIMASEPGDEDWGWYIHVHHKGSFFVGIAGTPHKNPSGDLGEWRIMIKKRRSLVEMLLGRNRVSEGDEIVSIVKSIIANHRDLRLIGVE